MMNDSINRQAAIDAITDERIVANMDSVYDSELHRYKRATHRILASLPSAQPEPLTDNEQRIFLAAMLREEKVCRQVDDEYRTCREPYEDSLVSICHEIIRKVKDALWTI